MRDLRRGLWATCPACRRCVGRFGKSVAGRDGVRRLASGLGLVDSKPCEIRSTRLVLVPCFSFASTPLRHRATAPRPPRRRRRVCGLAASFSGFSIMHPAGFVHFLAGRSEGHSWRAIAGLRPKWQSGQSINSLSFRNPGFLKAIWIACSRTCVLSV